MVVVISLVLSLPPMEAVESLSARLGCDALRAMSENVLWYLTVAPNSYCEWQPVLGN